MKSWIKHAQHTMHTLCSACDVEQNQEWNKLGWE